MICLKQLRTEAGLTQQQLAEGLGTTQQTIARWETGKTAIPSPVLKDLAIILNCAIEDILGTSTKRRSFYGRALTKQLKSKPEAVSLYGGLRLTIKGVEEELEFPIDEEIYKFVDRFFSDSLEKEKPEWLFLDTMDNWLLFINLKTLTSLETYDDDAQASFPFDHPEVYKALTSRLGLQEQELSEALLNYCQGKVNEFEDREESLWSYYNEAQIYRTHLISLPTRSSLPPSQISRLWEVFSTIFSPLPTGLRKSKFLLALHIGERSQMGSIHRKGKYTKFFGSAIL